MPHDDDALEREDRGGAFLMGMLAGTALGAGLGWLFESRSGDERRHHLVESATGLLPIPGEAEHRV